MIEQTGDTYTVSHERPATGQWGGLIVSFVLPGMFLFLAFAVDAPPWIRPAAVAFAVFWTGLIACLIPRAVRNDQYVLVISRAGIELREGAKVIQTIPRHQIGDISEGPDSHLGVRTALGSHVAIHAGYFESPEEAAAVCQLLTACSDEQRLAQ